MTSPSVAAQLEALHASDQRLVRTVDSLADELWREPSPLPGWSRAHVIAHIALNGEGLAGALEGLADGHVVPVYLSGVRRDEDIEALAAQDISAIRDRLFAATTRFRESAANVTETGRWDGTVLRLPEGPVWPAETIPGTRQREVEIHHADLDAAYSRQDWPAAFVADLLDQLTVDHGAGTSEGFSINATDLGRTWSAGAGEPVVEGTGADLGWWLTGRGSGDGLTSSTGSLPALGAWRKAPVSESP